METSQQGRPELIAPAGDMERLKTALHFGADAVYLSGKQFSLRTFSKNFTLPELDDAVRYVHARKKRAYLAANSFVRNQDLPPLRSFLEAVSEMGFDAVIVSDPAVFDLCRETLPSVPVHLSTQANTTNSARSAAEYAGQKCTSQKGHARTVVIRYRWPTKTTSTPRCAKIGGSLFSLKKLRSYQASASRSTASPTDSPTASHQPSTRDAT